MDHMLRLENTIVNLRHVTQANFTDAYAGGEPNDENPEQLTMPRKAKLELTLTSVHLDVKEYDYSEFTAAGGSESDSVVVLGELAERVWELLCRTASFGVMVQGEGA